MQPDGAPLFPEPFLRFRSCSFFPGFSISIGTTSSSLYSFFFFPLFCFVAGLKRPKKRSKGQVGVRAAIFAFAYRVTGELALVCLPIVVEGLICLLRNSLHNQRKASQKCLGPAGTAVVALVLNIGALRFILSEPICSPRGGEGQIGGRLRPANLQGVGNSRLTLCPFLFCLLFWVKTSAGEGEYPQAFPGHSFQLFFGNVLARAA